ncbi:MAG: hypothetical protein EOL97_14460 [Spirochaetia bacterium]|nr:hypothetical protein [Spirochaetia bacterium]
MLSKNLSDCFDIEEARKELDQIQEDIDNEETPNDILKSNVERAQRLLDRIEDEWAGGVTADTIKLVDIASKLITCITQAANSMITNDIGMETTNQKQEYLDLKKLEFEMRKEKVTQGDKSASTINNTQNNVYVTSREDILKLALQTQLAEKTEV